jgi:hypothetical protein
MTDETRYTLRERANFFAAPILGVLTPIVAARYTLMGDANGSAVVETAAWAASTVAAIPYSMMGLTGGLVLGICEANKLRRDRLAQEKTLEDSITT